MAFFALHVFPDFYFSLVDIRQWLRRLQLRHIRAEFAQHDPLHPRFNSRINDRFMRGDFRNGSHIDNSILVFESGDELVEGIGVGDAVDLDVWRECGFGGGAGEDFDVACEARIGVEGREDGWTEIAGGLKGGVKIYQ